jgi:hypothetical protein
MIIHHFFNQPYQSKKIMNQIKQNQFNAAMSAFRFTMKRLLLIVCFTALMQSSFGQNRHWSFNPHNNLIGRVDFGNCDNSGTQGTSAYLSNASTITSNMVCREDGSSPLVQAVCTTNGTEVYANGTLVTTLPEYDDEVGIVPIPNQQGIFHIIVADKIYKLNILGNIITPIPLQLGPTLAPLGLGANGAQYYHAFESGFAASPLNLNLQTYKVYTIFRSYDIGCGDKEYIYLVENEISYLNYQVISRNIIKVLFATPITVVTQNGCIQSGFLDKTYSEMEYANGKVLFGENSTLHIVDIISGVDITFAYGGNSFITGLEVDPTNQDYVWMTYDNALGNAADEEYYAKYKFTYPTLFEKIKFSEVQKSCQIETGPNSDLFTSHYFNGFSTKINQNAPFNFIGTAMQVYNGRGKFGATYSMPDQIDGWNYLIDDPNLNINGAIYSINQLTCDKYLISNTANEEFAIYFNPECTILYSAGQGSIVIDFLGLSHLQNRKVYIKKLHSPTGWRSSNYATINVPNINLGFIADFSYAPKKCYGSLSQFTDISTKTGNLQIVAWDWDLGMGSNFNSNFQNASILYPSPRDYDIELTVTCSNGCKDKIKKKQHLSTATVYSIPDQCNNGNSVFFTDFVDLQNIFAKYDLVGPGGFASLQKDITTPFDFTGKPIGLWTFTYYQCGYSSSRTFMLKQAPPAPTVLSGPASNVCENQVVQLSTNATNPKWTIDNAPRLDWAGQPNVSYTIPSIGSTIATRTINVYELSANGCLSDLLSLVITIDGAPKNIPVDNTYNVCNNQAQFNLQAPVNVMPPYYYQWYNDAGPINGATSHIYLLNNFAHSDTYYCLMAANQAMHCTTSAGNNFINIRQKPIITATQNPIPVNLSSTLSVPNIYVTYQWYFNGSAIANANSNSTIAAQVGNYSVHVDGGICGDFWAEIDLGGTCGGPAFNQHYANGGAIPNNGKITLTTPHTFGGTTTIGSGAHLVIDNTQIEMMSCAEIIIEDGGILEVEGSTFSSCGQWKGIFVRNTNSSGILQIRGKSNANGLITATEIRDAVFGIHCDDGIIQDLSDVYFSNNTTHLAIINTRSSNMNVESCKFGWLNNNPVCNPNVTAMEIPAVRKMVYLDKSDDIVFQEKNYGNALGISNQFVGQAETGIPFDRYAIHAYKVNLGNAALKSLDVEHFEMYGTMTQGMHLTNCKEVQVNGTSHAVAIANANGAGSQDNVDGTVKCGIYADGGEHLNVFGARFGDKNSTIRTVENGIEMNQVNGATIEESRFHNCINGVQYYNQDANQNNFNVTLNVFRHCDFGLVMAPNVHPNTCTQPACGLNTVNGGNQIELALSCNDFRENKVGVFGYGTIPDQGDVNTDVGDDYHAIVNNVNRNTDWDFLWVKDPLKSNPEVNYATLYFNINGAHQNLVSYSINASAIANSDISSKQTNNVSNVCHQTSKALKPAKLNEITKLEIQVYPIPANDFINILSNKTENDHSLKLQIVDVTGKIVKELNYQTPTNEIVDIRELSSGVYHLRLFSNNVSIYSTKIVKLRSID